MPLKIRVNNLNRKRKINKKDVIKAVKLVFRQKKKSRALIDVTFVSDRKIKALNKKYMRRSVPTDVLSFSLEENASRRRKPLIGDVYISSDTAHKNARRFKTNFRQELLLYVVHGALHLVGFGDKTFKEKKKIRKLEKEFMKKIVRSK